MCALTGNPDGSSEVDYTVNPATGFPWATGPRDLAVPLNSVLPAWDVTMGGLACIGILAAERHRTRTGEGQLIRLALSDVAFAMVGNLGRIAEVQVGGQDAARDGNYLYGAFGHDFGTSDGRRVMVVALTGRQWTALQEVTGTAEAFRSLEGVTGHDLSSEDGRFGARDIIAAVLRPWFEARTLDEIRAAFEGTGVSWGPVPDVPPARGGGPARVRGEPDVLHARAAGDRLLPRAGLAARAHRRRAAARAPRAGARRAHGGDPRPTCSGSARAEIGRLFDAGVVAGSAGFRRAGRTRSCRCRPSGPRARRPGRCSACSRSSGSPGRGAGCRAGRARRCSATRPCRSSPRAG